MNFNKLAIVALTLITLTACSSKEQYVSTRHKAQLPYTFKVSQFKDRRPVDKQPRLETVITSHNRYELNQEELLQSLIGAINNDNPFSYDEAFLSIELKDYAAIHENGKYTASFYLDLAANDSNGNPLASGLYSCFGSMEIGIDRIIKNKVTDTFQRNKKRVVSKREAKIWRQVYAKCLDEVAYQFNNHVNEKVRSSK